MTIKTCVIGLGAMGRSHVRVQSDLPGAKLVGASDPSEAARAAAAKSGLAVYDDYRRLFDTEKPDACIVSVPTEVHLPVALEALSRGIHVLVEKPIAPTVADAQKMIDAAKAANRVLMVGQIERFNPAVQELKRVVQAGELGKIFQLHARRLSPFPARIQDVGVILDLATHDIDAMHFVTGSRVVRAFAETARKAHKSCEDLLSGLVRFESGEIGVLDVSWLSPLKLRQLSVVGEGGVVVADYLAQDVVFYKNGKVNDSWEPASHFSGAVEGDMVKRHIAKKEPLRNEHEAFLRAVRGDEPVAVGGEDGLRALQVALAFIESGRSAALQTF